MSHKPPAVRQRTLDALVDRLEHFPVLVEVGIGRRTDLAGTLSETCEVRATDVVEREVPAGVAFFLDDVTDPDPSVYADADAIYALNLPPELHRPALGVARQHDAVLAFTTLGGDAPELSVRSETLPGETLFWAMETGPARDTG